VLKKGGKAKLALTVQPSTKEHAKETKDAIFYLFYAKTLLVIAAAFLKNL